MGAVLVACAAVWMLWAAVLSGPADAHNLQPLGPAPVECTTGISADCTFNSWVATFALSPHLVNVGEKITGRVTTLVEHCGDVFNEPCMKSFGWPAIGSSHGCPTGPTGGSCTFKATQATRGWTIACADIDALDGAESCDYYAVIGHKRAVSGNVSSEEGKPVSGATVTISGHGGGSVTTNVSGDYYAVLEPGRYSVSVRGLSTKIVACTGQKSAKACEVNLHRHDGEASFIVASHLNVTVKATPVTSGLSYDASLESPAFFVPGGEGEAEKCLSGCSNVEVTVTLPDGEPVQGASVSASVDPLLEKDLAPYPADEKPDLGHLCQASITSNCGSSISGVKTDSEGHADILYWAPGVLRKDTVELTATAEADCGECSGGHASGEGDTNVSVSPYLIYQHDVTLPRDSDVTRTIADWWKENGFFSESSIRGTATERLLTDAIELLGKEASTVVGAAMEVKNIHSHAGQEEAMTQLFDEQLGLTPFGLLATSPSTPWMSNAFVGMVGGKPGSVLFVFHYSQPGMLLRYGKQIDNPALPQILKLRLYEVSYCQQGTVCGPGGPAGGPPLKHEISSVTVDGIHSFMYFEFEGQEPAKRNYPEQPIEFTHPFKEHVVIPYQPRDWMGAQKGLLSP
jgi:hypothetical protein